MIRTRFILILICGTFFAPALSSVLMAWRMSGSKSDDSYLTWPLQQAESVGKSTRKDGRIGSWFDGRVIRTERSYNFKLRATWFTPEVIRASARFAQIRNRLSDEKTRALVEEAESSANAVFLIEIDPREGSGVIPLDWEAYLQSKEQDRDSIGNDSSRSRA